jgi:hypothetical protein
MELCAIVTFLKSHDFEALSIKLCFALFPYDNSSINYFYFPFEDETQTSLFKDPVHTAL